MGGDLIFNTRFSETFILALSSADMFRSGSFLDYLNFLLPFTNSQFLHYRHEHAIAIN